MNFEYFISHIRIQLLLKRRLKFYKRFRQNVGVAYLNSSSSSSSSIVILHLTSNTCSIPSRTFQQLFVLYDVTDEISLYLGLFHQLHPANAVVRIKRGFHPMQRTQRNKHNKRNARKNRQLQPIGTERSSFQLNSLFKVKM